MTDSIGDLLGRRQRNEPPEIQAIKDFVRNAFEATCSVAIKADQIVVSVPSAALASTLRMHITELQAAAETNKRITIRIDS